MEGLGLMTLVVISGVDFLTGYHLCSLWGEQCPGTALRSCFTGVSLEKVVSLSLLLLDHSVRRKLSVCACFAK